MKDRFDRGETSEKGGLFDRIASVYGLFYHYQTRHFAKILQRVLPDFNITEYKTILDVGCGTGALCTILKQRGLEVTGVDPAPGMLKVARAKTRQLGIDFVEGNALARLPFADKSFDLSIASYVLHGLKPAQRKTFYDELKRITRYKVIVYDYTDKRSALTSLVEWLEGGDYFNFIQVIQDEIRENFRDMRVLEVDERAAWYIGSPK